jgi:hypothetical protein
MLILALGNFFEDEDEDDDEDELNFIFPGGPDFFGGRLAKKNPVARFAFAVMLAG